MRYLQPILFLISLFLAANTFGQKTVEPHKAISNQFECIHHYYGEVHKMVKAWLEIYTDIKRHQQNHRSFYPQFVCPGEAHPFYIEQAQNQSGVTGTRLKPYSEALKSAYSNVETHCRQLETYFRLKSYEKDSFSGAVALIRSFQPVTVAYFEAQTAFEQQIDAAYRQLKTASPPASYVRAEQQLRQIINKEAALLTTLYCNFNPEIPGGWPVASIRQNINELDILLADIQKTTPPLDYPASHYYQAALDCARSCQSLKKDLADGYTLEARKNDEHANLAYWELLNMYNGCYVPFFKQFAGAFPDGKKSPLLIADFPPVFKMITAPAALPAAQGRFTDIPYLEINLPQQAGKIPTGVQDAVNKYVDFIDESVRLNNNLLTGLVNSRANLTSFPETGNFYYNDDTHKLPGSLYQETILANKSLPEQTRISIQHQAEVLMGIMTEMNEMRETLYRISKEKTYKTQGFNDIERIRDRYLVLFTTFDQYKERLYTDLKKIHAAYSTPDPTDSWVKSYQALSAVMTQNRRLLDTAKDYYSGGALPPLFSVEQHSAAVNQCITDEFVNMKGIERIGRYNGLCPYNPYEDIGATAQTLNTCAVQWNKKKYHDFVYLYNNSIMEYNRFVELSKKPFLKNIRQPEIFTLAAPPEKQARPTPPAKPIPPVPPVPEKPVVTEPAPRIIRDTVFIHDTVYLEKPPAVGPSFFSLEGYAPNNLILLLDVSSSMNTPDRLPLLQSSVTTLVQLFRPEDEIAVVVFSGTAKIVLPPSKGTDKAAIFAAINALKTGGKTDVKAGLELAYALSAQNFKPKGNNRIILATDGEFVLPEKNLGEIEKNAGQGITLTIFKFGQKPTPNLKTITTKGKGNLVSINAANADIFMVQEAKK